MKNLLLTTAAAALLATGAQAADINGSTKDSPTFFEAPSGGTVNWTGFYIGGAVGYGNSNHDLKVNQYNSAYCYDTYGDAAEFPEDFDPRNPDNQQNNIFGDPRVLNVPKVGGCEGALTDGNPGQYFPVDASSQSVGSIDGVNAHGLVGDVRLGYDQAMGRFVVGVFGSYGFNGMEANATNALGISGNGHAFDINSIEKGDEWSIGARAGLIVAPRTLVYILAAYTQTEYTFSGTDFGPATPVGFSKDTTFDGVTVGGGVEFALAQNIFFGIEGTHTFYGKETVLDTGGTELGGFGQRMEDDLGETRVVGTLKIKLNGDAFRRD